MRRRAFIGFVRRWWTPVFLLACIAFLAIRADELVPSSGLPTIRQPALLVLALVFHALSWLALAVGWKEILRFRLQKSAGMASSLKHLALMSLGKYVPGKVWGMVARGSSLTRLGITTDNAVDATALEQVIVVHSAGIVAAAFCLVAFPGWSAMALAVMAAASIIWGPSVVQRALSALTRLTSRLPQAGAPTATLAISAKVYARLMAHYSFAWLLHSLAFVAIYCSLRDGAPDAGTIGLLIFANIAGMVAGFVAVFAPAGIGVREAAITGLLAAYIGVGEAVVLSIAMRLWTTATDLVFGGLAIAFSGRETPADPQER